jgi:hypothetical protein
MKQASVYMLMTLLYSNLCIRVFALPPPAPPFTPLHCSLLLLLCLRCLYLSLLSHI